MFGVAVQAGPDGASFLCVSDTVFDSGLPVLEYGQQTAVAGVLCSSATTGVTCSVQPGGHGFTLSRDAVVLV